MKTYCILEQGKYVNEQLSIHKKEIFTTEYSDYYRLNWMRNDDPLAFISAKNIVWSEGRSLLYKKVPKNYLYYIFIDDDIKFSTNVEGEISQLINQNLLEFKPLSGCFFDPGRFTDPIRMNFLKHIKFEDCLKRRAFPIAGYDQQLQIFSKSYADVMFPCIYHGAGQSMWYSQWICHKLYPCKQICMTDVFVENTRKEEHLNQNNDQYNYGNDLIRLFNEDVRDKSYKLNWNVVKENNSKVFKLDVDKSEIHFTIDDLNSIYNTNNPFFKLRSSRTNKELEPSIKLKLRPSIYELFKRKISRVGSFLKGNNNS